MKHKKLTYSGIIIFLLAYAIICTYWPKAAILLIILPKIVIGIIPFLLIAVLFQAYKYFSKKNKP